MPLGPSRWAPASRLRHGHLGVDREGGVVVDAAALVEHAAVAVVGELVEAGVGHDDGGVADLGADVAQRHVEHAVRVDARAPLRVAAGGHPEEHQPADARGDRLGGRLAQRLAGVLHDARHGRDRHRLVDALPDEQGQHELAGPQVGLGDQPSHRGRGAQPPRPVGGEHLEDLRADDSAPSSIRARGLSARLGTVLALPTGRGGDVTGDMFQEFGPYRLEHLIGRGGMGEVYRAFDRTRGRTVALKRLPVALAGDPEYQARFRRESALAAQLSEPHIIPIHDFGEIDGGSAAAAPATGRPGSGRGPRARRPRPVRRAACPGRSRRPAQADGPSSDRPGEARPLDGWPRPGRARGATDENRRSVHPRASGRDHRRERRRGPCHEPRPGTRPGTSRHRREPAATRWARDARRAGRGRARRRRPSVWAGC